MVVCEAVASEPELSGCGLFGVCDLLDRSVRFAYRRPNDSKRQNFTWRSPISRVPSNVPFVLARTTSPAGWPHLVFKQYTPDRGQIAKIRTNFSERKLGGFRQLGTPTASEFVVWSSYSMVVIQVCGEATVCSEGYSWLRKALVYSGLQ